MIDEQPKFIIKDKRIWRVYPDGSMRRVVKNRAQHYSSTEGRKASMRHKGYDT